MKTSPQAAKKKSPPKAPPVKIERDNSAASHDFSPLIGITTYGRNDNNQFSLPAAYPDAVRRAGGIPILVTPGETRIEQILHKLDGLILSGGGDIDPERYGGKHHHTIYNVDEERDDMEIALVLAAKKSELPVLGICRGMQLMNVAFGGSLYEHLPDYLGEQVQHRLLPREPTEHWLQVESGCRLAKIMGKHRIAPTSWHHQALRKVAKDLQILAKSEDAVVEAVEVSGHPWFFGVQWHPEITAAHDLSQQNLFDALIQAARIYRDQ